MTNRPITPALARAAWLDLDNRILIIFNHDVIVLGRDIHTQILRGNSAIYDDAIIMPDHLMALLFATYYLTDNDSTGKGPFKCIAVWGGGVYG